MATNTDTVLAKRAVSLDQDGLTVAYNFEITDPVNIYTNENKSFSIGITHAQINCTATYSGHIKYSLLQAEVSLI